MSDLVIPAAVAAERAALGVAVAATAAADHVLDVVRAEDLTGEHRPRLLRALKLVREEGRQIDPPTVSYALHRLGVPADQADEVVRAALAHAEVGNLHATCQDVVHAAAMRRRQQAALELARAAGALDDRAYAEAEQRLYNADRGDDTVAWVDGQAQGEALAARLAARDARRVPTGMPGLDRVSGGLRPGQLTIVLGVTSHGKSALVDGMALAAAQAGWRVGLALNEQAVEERYERAVSRDSGVPLQAIDEAQTGRGRLTTVQVKALTDSAARIAGLPLAWLPAAGMAAVDLARQARRQRLDVLVVDGLQGLPMQPGRKAYEYLQDEVHALDEHAKRTGCHVLLAAHVNRQRLKADGTMPVPGLGDVADCTGATKRADNVLCLWRRQDPDTLDPTDEGILRMAKWRGARLESFALDFDGSRMRFTEAVGVHAGQVVARSRDAA